ncbi:MAG: RNA polymerase sigma factor [Acidimicrobiales bacterium]
MESAPSLQQWFTAFAADAEPRLRAAFVAALGQHQGMEASAEAMAYAWEHRERLAPMDNPVGYLYRVGRSRVRVRPARPRFVPVPPNLLPDVEPGLPAALQRLSERQRTVVVMVHAYGWSRSEAAQTLGMSVSTVDSHLQRGLAKLRRVLGVSSDA